MNDGVKCVYGALVLLLVWQHSFAARSLEAMQTHYKKIADGLIGIRKEHPSSQSKVYAMLDQLDKLHATAKNVSTKKSEIKNKVQGLSVENAALRQELSVVKAEIAKVRKSIEAARSSHSQKLEEEQKLREQLELERKELIQKVVELEQKRVEQQLKKPEPQEAVQKAELEQNTTPVIDT